ncbi:MAG: c-type cytochrome [Terriglobia bacterium]
MPIKLKSRVAALCGGPNAGWFEGPRRSIPTTICVLLILSPSLMRAQNSPATSSQFETATKMFAVECAGCHGADAHGTDHGPPLVGVRGLRRRSVS